MHKLFDTKEKTHTGGSDVKNTEATLWQTTKYIMHGGTQRNIARQGVSETGRYTDR